MTAANDGAPAPRICSFMANNRMLVIPADRVNAVADGPRGTEVYVCGDDDPFVVVGDLSEVARKVWGDAWSAGAASEGPREGGA